MATKSKVVKPASPQGRKASVKRSSPVKKIAKKAAAKKVAKPASPKGKKATVKKAAPKKAGAKKPVAKPASPQGRKAVAKKATAKKVAVKKAAPKKITKPAAKKAVSKPKSSVKAKPVSAASTPAMAELSEEMHEKAVHNEKENQSMMQSAQGAKALERKEDPIMAFDMHMAQKSTSKGDSNNKLRMSSTGQRPIRPSGKKPLWRK
jgi:CRISPR/Cas system CSM-associated protein Csm3 (group 7 of RAMP superfamily)